MTAPQTDVPIRPFLIGFPAVGLVLGFVMRASGLAPWADLIWSISTLPVLFALLVEIVRRLRRGDVGLDIVAALSMTAALVVGQELAAAVVALMYAGGQYLEDFEDDYEDEEEDEDEDDEPPRRRRR